MIGCGLVGAAVVIRSPHTVAAKPGEITQPPEPGRDAFIERAFAMRDLALSTGDQGYGALIVDASTLEIVGEAPSRVVTNGDPTGHAEIEAIRDAAHRLGARDLSAHVMYSSSRPCPMCEAAAYWARLDGMYFGPFATDAGAPRLCHAG